MTRRAFIHDPDCAVTRDVAPTADWDDAKHMPPVCTCRERQRARIARRAPFLTGGESERGTMRAEGDPVGGGNYVQPNRYRPCG